MTIAIASLNVYNNFKQKTVDKTKNNGRIHIQNKRSITIIAERGRLMNKNEITKTLNKLSDEKLDLFLSYLRDISDSGQPLPPSPQAEPQAS